MKVLEVNGLSFGYSKGSPIFSDVSFSLESGEFVCVLGPNGVGKSTLIKCINGIFKPSKGTIRILDKDISEYDLKEMARTVGYVPVMSSDFNIMTVLDTVLVGRYAHQKWKTGPADLKIAHKALEAMEIEELAMCNFNELSAGQHQKVAIARGLAQEPKILMLDEPTANLDVRHQIYVSEFLKKLSKSTGMTVLMICHDLNIAARFADRLIIMGPPGKIVAQGPPWESLTPETIEEVYHVKSEVIDMHGTPHVVLDSVIFEDGP